MCYGEHLQMKTLGDSCHGVACPTPLLHAILGITHQARQGLTLVWKTIEKYVNAGSVIDKTGRYLRSLQATGTGVDGLMS